MGHGFGCRVLRGQVEIKGFRETSGLPLAAQALQLYQL